MGAVRTLELINRHIPFNLEEFCIEGVEGVPPQVVDKIWRHHICPVLNVREEIGLPLTASAKSCYRSKEWELKQGRSGNSQHTFGVGEPDEEDWLGACDWTFYKAEHRTYENMAKLLKLLAKETRYTRLCRYETFIHADYKLRNDQTRVYQDKGDGHGWQFAYSFKLK